MTPDVVMRAVWVVWWVLWMAAAFWSDRAAKAPPRRYEVLYRLFPADRYSQRVPMLVPFIPS